MNILKLFLITLLLTFVGTGTVRAEEMSSSSAEITKVDYQLPYPGILPDHPLYFLKASRDRVFAFFISNPMKKAEFDLLQADKRVWSSLFLVQKGKQDLSESTFSKGENYFEDGLNRMTDAKSQGTGVKDLAKKYITANQKHKEILDDIKRKINDKNSKKFKVVQERLTNLGKRAEELSK